MTVRRTLEKIFTHRGVISQTRGAGERLARFIFPAQQSQQMPASGPKGLVIGDAVRGNLFERGKTGGGLDRLRHRYGPPDQRADSGRDSRQTLIEQEYLLPVDASANGAVGVNGLNGRLQLIAPHAVERRSRPQMAFRFGRQRAGPKRGVLLIERRELAAARVTRRAPSFTVQHERQQAMRFRFIGRQFNEGSPDGDGLSSKSMMRCTSFYHTPP